MKKLFDKFGKMKVYATGIVASIVAVIVFVMFAMPHENPLILKQESFIIEYGEIISTESKEYLKTEDKKVLKETIITIGKVENEKNKDYPKVGSYDAVANYNKKSVEFIVEVKDTKSPVFKDIMKEIVIEENAEDVDFTKYFQAEDLSEVKITVDSEKVDLSKIGEYEIKVTATDKYKNADTKTVKVKVISLENAFKEDGTTKTLDGTVYQSKALKDKIAEEKKVEEKDNPINGSPSNGSNSNTGGSTSGGNSNTGGSTGGSNNNTGGSQTPPPNVCVPNGQFGRVGNSAKTFGSKAEADLWAETYILSQTDWMYSGWYAWTVYDNCGERNDVWTIDFY